MTVRKGNAVQGGRGAVLALVAATVAMSVLVLPACSAQSETKADTGAEGSKVVAKVMGQEVTMAEVEKQASAQLEQVEMQLLSCQANAEQQRHQVIEGSVRQLVQDRMLDAEAKERGVTRDELVTAEVDSKLGEVTDADVDTFYTENQGRINRPKEQVAAQIKQYLGAQRRNEAYSGFVEGLEKKYESIILLEPPRKEVAATGPAKGPESAPITIVEFSDFECPFCSRVVPTLNQVHQTYGDKVRIVFRQFPLAMHPNAQKAAEASLCANDQGKFWELHDAMFAQQRQLAVADLKAKAAQLGLEAGKFDQCLDSGEYADEVAADMREGAKAGVSGTPALFVNGIFISGAVPYEQIAQVIDEELARKTAQN
jgi:protein-disulfide isomerase